MPTRSGQWRSSAIALPAGRLKPSSTGANACCDLASSVPASAPPARLLGRRVLRMPPRRCCRRFCQQIAEALALTDRSSARRPTSTPASRAERWRAGSAPTGPLKANYIYHAEADRRPRRAASAEIVMHERDRNAETRAALRAFRVLITPRRREAHPSSSRTSSWPSPGRRHGEGRAPLGGRRDRLHEAGDGGWEPKAPEAAGQEPNNAESSRQERGTAA